MLLWALGLATSCGTRLPQLIAALEIWRPALSIGQRNPMATDSHGANPSTLCATKGKGRCLAEDAFESCLLLKTAQTRRTLQLQPEERCFTSTLLRSVPLDAGLLTIPIQLSLRLSTLLMQEPRFSSPREPTLGSPLERQLRSKESAQPE